jgi:hypothetical protein
LKSGVNGEAVNNFRRDSSAHVLGGLDNDDFSPLLFKHLSGAETGEAGPHNDDVGGSTHGASQSN